MPSSLDFSSLPLLCKIRFTELCDSSVLFNFAQINKYAKYLCKKRKVVQNLRICSSPSLYASDISVYATTFENYLKGGPPFEIVNALEFSEFDLNLSLSDVKLFPLTFIEFTNYPVKFQNDALIYIVNSKNLKRIFYCGDLDVEEINDFKKVLDSAFHIQNISFKFWIYGNLWIGKTEQLQEILNKWIKKEMKVK